jgi:peptide/nickel transport system substrate-binding protein
VRQAVALAFNRPAMISALLAGDGQPGNHSPFAPKFPSTDTSVPQRAQNIAKAKALLKAARHPNGFSATITTENYEEIPQLAQVMAQELKAIGLDIKLNVETQSNYDGKATFGQSDWLDATMSLVDYGDRGVPNVFLQSALTTKGTWNAAHVDNAQYDKLVADYVAAVDLQSQKKYAGQIEALLLAQTPIVIPYFSDALTTTTTRGHRRPAGRQRRGQPGQGEHLVLTP